MKYPFGQAFTHLFYPVDTNGNPISVSSTAPAIYLYGPDSRPSMDQARAGSGSPLQSLVTWTSTTVPLGKAIAFSAVSDPSPTTAQAERKYYVATNYYLETSAQLQTRVEEILLTKTLSQNSTHGVTITFIKSVYAAIPAFLDDDDIINAINVAVELVRLDLDASGYQWAQIQETYRYKMAVASKTLYIASIGQRKEQGDKFDLFATDMNTLYDKAIAVSVRYDTDKDGTPDAKTEKQGYSIAIT